MTDTKTVAKKEAVTAVAVATEKPVGFEGLDANEFAPPVIKLWQKMTKGNIEGGVLGQWYEVNSGKAIGTTLIFNLLAVKNLKFTKEDKKTGDIKIQSVKNLLIYVRGSILPKVLSLSVTSFNGLRKVLTAAYEASVQNGGLPLYAFDITATTEVTSNENGDYAITNFTLGKPVSNVGLKNLSGLFDQFGKTFAAGPEISTEEAMK